MITVHSCGCTTTVDPAWSVKRSVRKCSYHVDFSRNMPRSEEYYRSLGCFSSMHTHPKELMEALGPLPKGYGHALEIGCGASQYVRLIQEAGYSYTGLEPNKWAAEWTEKTYNVPVLQQEFTSEVKGEYSLVLCAHALEHMLHAPDALVEIHRLLVPGGCAVIVVPNDEDMTNPDHLWFFTAETLKSAMSRVGFKDVVVTERRIVHYEGWLYCRAYA